MLNLKKILRGTLNHRRIAGLAVMVTVVAYCGLTWGDAHFSVYNFQSQQKALMSDVYSEIGRQMAERGYLQSSSDLLDKAYRLSPSDVQRALDAISILDAQGLHQQAISLCQQSIDTMNSPLFKSILTYKLSLLEDEQHDTLASITALQRAITYYPGQKPGLYYFDMSLLYARLNRYDQTAFYSEKALVSLPTSAEVWNNFGYSLAKLGDYANGLNAIEKSIALAPNDPATLDSLGYIEFHLGHYNEAISAYEKAVAFDPKAATSLLFLARSYVKMHACDKAVNNYEAFLKLPSDAIDKQNAQTELDAVKSHPTNCQTTTLHTSMRNPFPQIQRSV